MFFSNCRVPGPNDIDLKDDLKLDDDLNLDEGSGNSEKIITEPLGTGKDVSPGFPKTLGDTVHTPQASSINACLEKIISATEPAAAEELKKVLEAYDRAATPEDKRIIRAKLQMVFVKLQDTILKSMVEKPNCSVQEYLLGRFGLLDGAWLNERQVAALSAVQIKKHAAGSEPQFPILYMDEWLSGFAAGDISSSSGDDLSSMTKKSSASDKAANIQKLLLGELKGLNSSVAERSQVLLEIVQNTQKIGMTNFNMTVFKGSNWNHEFSNNNEIENMKTLLTRLTGLNRFIVTQLEKLKILQGQLDTLKASGAVVSTEVSQDALDKELGALRQMMKMCVGRRGNEFAILSKEFMGTDILDRETVLSLLKEIEYLDKDLYYWKFQGIEMNNRPYIILAPCYSDTGICWEPVNPRNKTAGRGKCCIPLMPTDQPLKVLLYALADYRWQKAKEAASSYWMNEGLTGLYYMYHEELKKQKRKGISVKFNPDLKESFIEDYVLWIAMESKGMQKLTKEVRQIFWFHIPFPDEVKDMLKDRGYHYKQLWENDQRKKSSRGY